MPTINVHITAPEHRLNDDVLSLDVTLDLTLADLKAYIQAETELEPSNLRIFRDGQILDSDTKTLSQSGIKDGDMLAVLIRKDHGSSQPAQSGLGSSGQVAGLAQEAERVRQQLLQTPALLQQQPPEVRQAVNNPQQFKSIFEQALRARGHNADQSALMDADPFNIEAQKRIEEEIRRENVQANMDHAMNYNPESFASVTMLYINVEVNGTPIKAFVDSGAQSTIMSPSCAESCNIMRLIDTRFRGVARGVGTATILGKVHSADLNIAGHFLPCSFMVMEGKAVDLLLGLDMLKRYQACIDLKHNKLSFGDFDVPFLPESEIPKFQEEERAAEPTVPGPDGTEIGTQSGTVRPSGSIPQPGDVTATLDDPRHSAGEQQPRFAPTSLAPGNPAVTGRSRWPKEKIDQLVGLGFSEPEAIQALDACDGNVEVAAGMLFN